jgi:ribosome-binding protein aMBF1 (putative translation factor)
MYLRPPGISGVERDVLRTFRSHHEQDPASAESAGNPPMADSGKSSPTRYFGRQVRRARTAAGWTLAEFGQRTGYDAGQISRIETGRRPPTELFAACCSPLTSLAPGHC